MECERCGKHKALYRVYSDILNIAVCESCATEARQLGIPVQFRSYKQRR
jgi:hypothetical protein